ncbi:MAG: hypothetical protein IKY67_06195 [Paludibacteraceae bacterium]|nr:hypothetical protein [Paludibacteraceae bacterium]
MDFSKKIVVAVIALNVVFTAAALFVCWHTMQSIDALVVGFFTFTTGELWALSKIRRDELSKEKGGEVLYD